MPGKLPAQPGDKPLLSIVSAAYGEERNLPELHRRLCSALDGLDVDWEWIVVDDHSADDTFGVIGRLAAGDRRVRGLRFTRNFGSHMAIMCGLERARGHCAIVLAADLQDPPEIIPQLLEKWRSGAEVVWAERQRRLDDKARTVLLARLYYFIMRHVVGIKEMPSAGADFFLVGRRAIDALCRSNEGNVSILGLLAWMGFSQESITYAREPRRHGSSGWNLQKKLKLVADSITAFSYLPIRVMSGLGILFACGGLALALCTVIVRLTGWASPPAGYAALMTVLLLGFGFVMTFLGILGEYLWRTFDEVRGRPRYIIDRAVNLMPGDRPTGAHAPKDRDFATPEDRLEPCEAHAVQEMACKSA